MDLLKRIEQFLINEEYFTSSNIKVYTKDRYIEVFVNPSKAELRKIGKGNVRFVADSENKKVYAWDANYLHDVVWEKIIAPKIHDGRRYDDETLLRAGAKNGDFTEFDGNDFDKCHDDLASIIFADRDHWRWVSKYIDGLEHIISYTEKYRDDDGY
jgi:hypothetical protein